MNSFSIGLIFSLSLTLVFADHGPSEKEIERAIRVCNATHPVQKDPNLVIVDALETGRELNFSVVEKCYMLCFYRELKLYDENGKMNMIVLKDWLFWDENYDIMVASGMSVNNATRNFENKCDRALVNFYQLMFQEFVLENYDPSERIGGPKKQNNGALENGKPIVTLLQPKVKQTSFFHKLLKRAARNQHNKINGQEKLSYVESPLQQQIREMQ